MAEGCIPPSGAPPHTPPVPNTKVETVVPQTTGILRRLIPLASFFIAFTAVMTLLLVYMDSTALRHHQFRMNMSRDDDLRGVAQDDPQLIAYIREVHLRPALDPNNYHAADRVVEATDSQKIVAKLLANKKEGVFVEAGAYKYNRSSDTEWLERNLSWSGLLIQPNPRDYFNLKKHGRGRSQSIHACLSPTFYPKEVTFHPDERDGVKINSVHANSIDDEWFNTRVKCFPLYSLLLAINCTNIDYLSLDTDGTELKVLETLPFDRTRIEIIDVHIAVEDEKLLEEIQTFLAEKNYKFLQNFKTNYIFLLNHVKI